MLGRWGPRLGFSAPVIPMCCGERTLKTQALQKSLEGQVLAKFGFMSSYYIVFLQLMVQKSKGLNQIESFLPDELPKM